MTTEPTSCPEQLRLGQDTYQCGRPSGAHKDHIAWERGKSLVDRKNQVSAGVDVRIIWRTS